MKPLKKLIIILFYFYRRYRKQSKMLDQALNSKTKTALRRAISEPD